MMTEKENAALGRRMEELDAKRLKLKLIAQQHRSETEQELDLEEARLIREEIDSIKEQRATFIPENRKENYKMADFNETMNKIEVVETQEYRSGWLKTLTNRKEQMTESEKRAMTTVNNLAVVPVVTLNLIMGRLMAQGTLRDAVQIYNLQSLVTIPIEDIINDAAWLPEAVAGTIVNDTTRKIDLTHFKLARFIQVSIELEKLSISAVEAWIVDRMVQKIGVGLEKAIATGTGIGQPTGFITGTTWDATNSFDVDATALSYGDFVDLEGALGEDYITDAFYIMDRKSLAKIRKLKDDTKRPLFDTEIVNGFVGRLGGIPVRLSSNVDGVYLASWKSAWVGNFIQPLEFAMSGDAGFLSVSTIFRAYTLFDGKPTNIKGSIARIQFV